MTIFDVAKGVSWTDKNKIFFTPKNSKDSVLVEYLNDVDLNDIDIEINKLETFNLIENISKREEYIANKLCGFDEFKDGYFAKIAGFDDFSIMVLYDIDNNSIFLKRVYDDERYFIDLQNLISLLKKTKAIKTAFE